MKRNTTTTPIPETLKSLLVFVLPIFLMTLSRLPVSVPLLIIWMHRCGWIDNDKGYSVQQASRLGYISTGSNDLLGVGGRALLLTKTSGTIQDAWAHSGGEDSVLSPAGAYATVEIDWLLSHARIGCYMSCTWLVDNVFEKGDRYGQEI